MSDPTVLDEARGAVALVTPDRPQALDTFTRVMRGLAATRTMQRAAASNGVDKQLDLERATRSAPCKTCDCFEGVRAFPQKRWPQFKGE